MPQIVVETFTKLAARMMDNFGATAVLSRVIQTYDAATDQTVTTISTSNILAVLLKPRLVENNDGVKTKQTLLGSNTALAPDDRVTLGDKTYRVESVEETAPAGVVYFWTAVVI